MPCRLGPGIPILIYLPTVPGVSSAHNGHDVDPRAGAGLRGLGGSKFQNRSLLRVLWGGVTHRTGRFLALKCLCGLASGWTLLGNTTGTEGQEILSQHIVPCQSLGL